MTIDEAKHEISLALDGDAHSTWIGYGPHDKSETATRLASGNATLDEIVAEIEAETRRAE